MSAKPRKPILMRSDDRVVIYAGLFLVCAMLSSLGMGPLALLCFLPAAFLFEGLSVLSQRAMPRTPSRSM